MANGDIPCTQMKEVKLTKTEQAILALADYIERLPYNDYMVVKHITELLGYEQIAPKKKKRTK